VQINSDAVITKILDEAKIIAVVGLSSDAVRPSYSVSRYMQQQGYRIIPVNPNETSVLGESAYASLAEVPGQVDLVNIFRRSDDAARHVDEAIAMGVRAVWLQEEVIDEAAAERALAAGLDVVMDRCILKEHIKRRR
jgi:predicted CoA-binding protein